METYCAIEVRFRNGEIVIKTFDSLTEADNFFNRYRNMVPDLNNPRTQVMVGYPRYVN